jgi:hypothetical protein
MKKHLRVRSLLMLGRMPTVAVMGLLLAAAPPVLAGREDNTNPGVIPPDSRPYQKSYAKWGAAWWQWVLGIPADKNPLFDLTGEFAAEGQSGPVWFLAGSWVGYVERTCTVPAGKALFFPLANVVSGAAVYDCQPSVPDTPCEVPVLRSIAKSWIDPVDLLEAEVDGVTLQDLFSYRAAPPGAFPITIPELNVVGLPAGAYAPHVCDGYWLMVEPLKAGQHTIHFKAGGGNYDQDVTYHLTAQ